MELTKENIYEILLDYFEVNYPEGSYTYELTRVKEAFDVGTMSMDDIEEWGDSKVDDLANYIWDKFTR